MGFTTGEKHTLEIKAQRGVEARRGESSVTLVRVRQRPKEIKLSPNEYKLRTGKDAAVGQDFTTEPYLPGRVESVDEKQVTVRFTAEDGKEVDTPFGKGTIRERPDRYEIVIDAHPGSLVRSGGMVGRITAVTDRGITVDYGHPLGGETLLCDVVVESVKPGNQPGTEAGPGTKANAQK